MRIVMHVDMDCFFAAVEEREDPALKGRPVVVGADPRGGQGRGIVATCNYEARRRGLRSAMPVSTAWRLCPQAVYLRPRFDLYRRASMRVMDRLRACADVFEQAGIDEAYLEVSSLGGFEKARDLARRLQAEIAREEGLSCSVGMGPNKLVAKVASDHKKPHGLTVVIPGRVLEFLGPKDLGCLRGVGPKTRERLAALGYTDAASLRGASEAALVRELGSFGSSLLRQSRGLDDRPLEPEWEAKSMGRERTFLQDTGDPAVIRETLLSCVDDVHGQMAGEGLWCRELSVKIRFEGYETHSRQRTLKQATADPDQMRRSALALLEPFLASGRRFRLVGFSAGRFSEPEELLPLTTQGLGFILSKPR